MRLPSLYILLLLGVRGGGGAGRGGVPAPAPGGSRCQVTRVYDVYCWSEGGDRVTRVTHFSCVPVLH